MWNLCHDMIISNDHPTVSYVVQPRGCQAVQSKLRASKPEVSLGRSKLFHWSHCSNLLIEWYRHLEVQPYLFIHVAGCSGGPVCQQGQ